jgi:hypothetical protein
MADGRVRSKRALLVVAGVVFASWLVHQWTVGEPTHAPASSKNSRELGESAERYDASEALGEPESTSQSMSFEQCLQAIRNTASRLGIAPINIVETNILRMVRFCAHDESVLVTCSQPDRKMVITTSPIDLDANGAW